MHLAKKYIDTMYKKSALRRLFLTMLLFSAPLFSYAQTADLTYIDDLITQLQAVVNTLVPLLIGIAVVVFIFGVIRFVTAGEDATRKEAARGLMIYGIIALFVIVSIWGLVNILQDLTGTAGVTTIPVPQIP